MTVKKMTMRFLLGLLAAAPVLASACTRPVDSDAIAARRWMPTIKAGEQQAPLKQNMVIGSVHAYLVPQRAVTFNARGEATAYFVSAGNTVEQRVLMATRDMNNAWVVTAGVAEGDRLIVDGLQKISDGTAVTPVPVTINEDGVIIQDMSASAAPMGAPEGATPPGDGASAPADGSTQTTESAQ